MNIRPVVMVKENERLGKILKLMKKGTRSFAVMKGFKYIGMITDRTISGLNQDSNIHVGSIAWKSPVIRKDMTLEEMSERFVHGYRELPVIEKNQVIGVVRHTDILSELLKEGRVPKKRVKDLMSSGLISQDAKESVKHAAALMRLNKIHHIVVTDNGKFLDILSTADILPFLVKVKDRLPMTKERKSRDTIQLRSVIPVGRTVSKIRSNAFLPEAARKAIKDGVSTLLVYDKEPKGLIHVLDIIRSSLPSNEIQLDIVGLKSDDKEYRDDLRRECQSKLKTFDKIFPIQRAKLMVKVYNVTGLRKKYSIRFMITGKKTFESSASGWDIFNVLHDVLNEIRKQVRKEKSKRKGKHTGFGKLRRLSARIQQGIFYPGKPVK